MQVWPVRADGGSQFRANVTFFTDLRATRPNMFALARRVHMNRTMDTRSKLSALCDELIEAESEYRRAARQHRIMGNECTRLQWQRAKRRMGQLEQAVRELLADEVPARAEAQSSPSGSFAPRPLTNLGFGGLRCVQERPRWRSEQSGVNSLDPKSPA